MNPHRQVIAIDGPSAAGKSTVARIVAERLGALLFDTGALYRALTLAAIRRDVPPGDGDALAALANEITIDLRPAPPGSGHLYLVAIDDENVTAGVRSAEVEQRVSEVAAHPEVRHALLPHQRRIAAAGPVVMVGRDIGTVVVPNAELKIYLSASERERTRRRVQEIRQRGEQRSEDEVLTQLRRRDAVDSSRSTAPLRPAADAVVVETDGRTIEEVVAEILRRSEGLGDGVPTAPSFDRR